jgi:hypothetical protein
MKLFLAGLVSIILAERLCNWERKVNVSQELCAFLALPQIKFLKLSPILVRAQGQYSGRGEVELKNPEFFFRNRWQTFNGNVFVDRSLKIVFPEDGKVELQGRFECDHPWVNFSGIQDGIFKKPSRKLKLKPGRSKWSYLSTSSFWPFLWGRKMREALQDLLRPYPHLKGIVWAVWTGDSRELDPDLVEMYRAGGLLPLVALSGQHVSVLVVMVRALVGLFGKLIFRFKLAREYYRIWDLILPSLASFLLALTSQGAPSVVRTLAMAFALCLLRFRRCLCSTTQIVCSSAALMIVWDPGLLTGISFVLSVVSTFFLVEVSQAKSVSSSFEKYFYFSTVMALLSCPLILFYFGQWSYLAPLTTICFSWLWNLLIIPVGFLVPLAGILPEGFQNRVLNLLDSGWAFLNSGQLLSQKLILESFHAYPRPTVWETLVLQASCLILLQIGFSKKRENDALRLL